MISSSRSLPFAFVAALTIHVGIAVSVGLLVFRASPSLPDFSFRTGKSATKITVVLTRAAQAQQPHKARRRQHERKILCPSSAPSKSLTKEKITASKPVTTPPSVAKLFARKAYSLPLRKKASLLAKVNLIRPKFSLAPLASGLPVPPSPPLKEARQKSVNSRETQGDLQPKGIRATLRSRSPIVLVYPPEAKRRGQEGTVLIKITLLPSGRAGTVTVLKSSGFYLLDQAAVETYLRARYYPVIDNGRRVKRIFGVPVKWETPIQYK